MRWCTDEISMLGRQKQEDPEFKVILGNSKFPDNLGYVRPCLKINEIKPMNGGIGAL